jgi:putative tricarboxylic transport membrane protein
MDLFANLALGFQTALSPANLGFVFIGAVIGTLFGAFPGLSAPTAIALLLPLTFALDPTSAIIMLAGIYYGSQYGNSISAVLLGIPGDSAAVVTAIEGHKLTDQGRAGHALTIAATSSFAAGIIGVVIFAAAGPPLAWFGLRFGDPEYAAVILLAFCMLPAFATEGRVKMLVALALGLLFATVGLDYATARPRFTFNQTALLDGLPFVAAIIGLFGVSDVLYNAGIGGFASRISRSIRLRELFPPASIWPPLGLPMLRSSALGFFIGVLPGAGATIASFAAYAMERAVARDRSTFGRGRLEGLVAGEAGNSGASIGAMLPMIALGIPGSGATAVMLGGFLIWGLEPGPTLFVREPAFVWGLVASMLIGNVMLLAMNVLLVPGFAWALRMPYAVLAPLIVVFCAAGTYAVNNSFADVWIMFAFGVLGYLLRLLDVPLAPLVLGLVLGPSFESHLRRTMQISDEGLLIFTNRPLSAAILAAALVLILLPPLVARYRRRSSAEVAEEGGTADGRP